MFSMKTAVAAVAFAAAVANAIPFRASCIKKGELFGNAASTGTPFDQTSEIVSALDTTMIAVFTRTCTTSSNLNAFQLLMNLPDGDAASRVTMSSVGPSGVGTCSVQEITARGHAKGAVFYSETGINAVGFQYDNGEVVWIGTRSGTAVIVELTETSEFIGFYGIQGESSIEAVGYLTHDPACSALPEPEILVDAEEDDEDQTTLIIVGACVGAFLIILIVCICICCKRRSNKSKTTVQVLNTETGSRQDSQVELKGNTSAPSLPAIDTEEEHAQGVNVKTTRITPGDSDKMPSERQHAKKDYATDITAP